MPSAVKCPKIFTFLFIYRGADKSFARPGRKQATATEDFYVHTWSDNKVR